MQKIIFVGGGTLGHIYPFIPVVKEIKDCYELYFIGTTNGLERSLIERTEGFKECFYLQMQGFRRRLSWYNIKTIKLYFQCKKEVNKIFDRIKPDLVIGMGGYISGVVLNVSLKRKIKTIIHEQNAVLGLANRLLVNKVDMVLLSFPVTNKIKNPHVKVIGNPRLSEIYYSYKIHHEENKFIVIVGGSRGSEKINDLIIDCYNKLIALGYRIVLITGKKYYEKKSMEIKKILNKQIQIIPFTEKLIEYLKRASIVISRSGATTLVELMALSKICLFIPSPNVTNNHQEKNADILVNKECALKLLEKDLTSDSLLSAIQTLENQDLRIKFRNNMRKLANYHATEDFIKEISFLISPR